VVVVDLYAVSVSTARRCCDAPETAAEEERGAGAGEYSSAASL